jgi:hypothetical protein
MSNKISYGYGNELTKNLVGLTIAQVLGDVTIKAVLGFGTGVVAKINGAPVGTGYVIREGDSISVEQAAQEKAATSRITLRYGAANVLSVQVDSATTVRSVLQNPTYRAALGFTDGVVAKINGASVNDDLTVSDGMTIDIETRAQEKAA